MRRLFRQRDSKDQLRLLGERALRVKKTNWGKLEGFSPPFTLPGGSVNLLFFLVFPLHTTNRRLPLFHAPRYSLELNGVMSTLSRLRPAPLDLFDIDQQNLRQKKKKKESTKKLATKNQRNAHVRVPKRKKENWNSKVGDFQQPLPYSS